MRLLLLILFPLVAFGRGGLPPVLNESNAVTPLDWNLIRVEASTGPWYITGPDPTAEIPAVVEPPSETPPSLSGLLNAALLGTTNMAYGPLTNLALKSFFNQATNAEYPKGINTNFWLRNLQGWRSVAFQYESSIAPALVSPEHFVVARHAIAPDHAQFTFYGTNGSTTWSRTQSTTNWGPTYPLSGIVLPEFCVGLLSNAVASADTVAVASSNAINAMVPYQTYLLCLTRQAGSNTWIVPRILYSISGGLHINHSSQSSLPTVTLPYSMVGGDSGFPNFVTLSNKLAYVGSHTFTTMMTMADAGDIKAAMDMLSDNAGRARQPLTVLDWTNNAVVWRTLE